LNKEKQAPESTWQFAYLTYRWSVPGGARVEERYLSGKAVQCSPVQSVSKSTETRGGRLRIFRLGGIRKSASGGEAGEDDG